MYNISLVVGDWSRDGHNQTDEQFYVSNKDWRGIETAYKSGIEKMQVPEYNSIAEDYQDSILPKEVADKLKKYIDFDSLLLDGAYEDEDSYELNTDSFTELYVRICKVGDPELTLEKVQTQTINIGGYGLFYS